jgi:hypothetical protein
VSQPFIDVSHICFPVHIAPSLHIDGGVGHDQNSPPGVTSQVQGMVFPLSSAQVHVSPPELHDSLHAGGFAGQEGGTHIPRHAHPP